jgi:hypothetical protein
VAVVVVVVAAAVAVTAGSLKGDTSDSMVDDCCFESAVDDEISTEADVTLSACDSTGGSSDAVLGVIEVWRRRSRLFREQGRQDESDK